MIIAKIRTMHDPKAAVKVGKSKIQYQYFLLLPYTKIRENGLVLLVRTCGTI